ncbi:MAG: 3-deoxy-manno-octulosonate cytidylyltransferase [Planctomycetota bacterium]
MDSCVVIPARLASTRLPRKMLLADTGLPLVLHTYEAARGAKKPSSVIVATDSEEILSVVQSAGGQAVMTSPDCVSGTDRVAEVARQRPEFDLFVNLQGDEPELDPAAIDRVVAMLEEDSTAAMATLATPIHNPARVADPANVKVVFDDAGRALYFSRSPIPYLRDPLENVAAENPTQRFQHVGLYAYQRDFLLRLADLPPSPLEQAEKLEQLRVLEAGETIRVGQIANAAPGIDTADDYAAFVQRCHAARAAA